MKTDALILIGMILLFITFNFVWYLETHKTTLQIEYRDRIIEKECLLNCTENGNQILCKVPDNKNLTITKVEYYTSILK